MPTQFELEIPGSFTLDEIENGLVIREGDSISNLVALAILPDGPNGEHSSKATLETVDELFSQLQLVKVPSGTKNEDIPKLAPGKKNFLTATIWVENQKTKVAAFR